MYSSSIGVSREHVKIVAASILRKVEPKLHTLVHKRLSTNIAQEFRDVAIQVMVQIMHKWATLSLGCNTILFMTKLAITVSLPY